MPSKSKSPSKSKGRGDGEPSTPTSNSNMTKEDRTYMLRCYYQVTKLPKGDGGKKEKKDKKSRDVSPAGTGADDFGIVSSETMSSLVPVTFNDTPIDVARKILEQLERRGVKDGIAGEVKPKHLRLCIVMETFDNNIYAVPAKVPVSRSIRRSLAEPPEAPMPLVGAAVLLSAKQIKKDNPSYSDDNPTSARLDIPPVLKAFLSVSFPIRAKPAISSSDYTTDADGVTSSIFDSMGTPRRPRSPSPAAASGDGVPPNAVPPPTAPSLKMPPSAKKLPPKIAQPAPPVMSEAMTHSAARSPSPQTPLDMTNGAAANLLLMKGSPSPLSASNGNHTAAGPPTGFVTVSISNAQAVDCVAAITLRANAANRELLEDYNHLVTDMFADPSAGGADGGVNDSVLSNHKRGQHSGSNIPLKELTVNCVYYRGDPASEVIAAALVKMQCQVQRHLRGLERAIADGPLAKVTGPDGQMHNISTTTSIMEEDEALLGIFRRMLHYLQRANPSGMMLCVNTSSSSSGSGGDSTTSTFAADDALPALPSTSKEDPTVRMELVDLGPNFIPRGNPNAVSAMLMNGGGSSSCNTTNNNALVSPTAAAFYEEKLRREQQGVKDMPSVDYANREAHLGRLSKAIEAMLKENEQMEKEAMAADEALAALEKEAAIVAEDYHAAKSAGGGDIQRLVNLKSWFEGTLAERSQANVELQQRVLLGDDYEPVMYGGGADERGSPSSAAAPANRYF